jgi:hypothetical protein
MTVINATMLIRFCSDCCEESTETSWSDRFRARLCPDCFTDRCEQIDRDYAMNSYELWVEAGKP